MRMVSMAVILAGVFAISAPSLRAGQAAEQRPAAAGNRSSEGPVTEASQIAREYCAGCHNGVMRSPTGATLEPFDPAKIAEDPARWARAYRHLQAGTMPPVGAPRPVRFGYNVLLTAIETGLGADAAPPTTVSDQEIADRLALLLWNSAPDAALIEDVRRNRLVSSSALEAQVVRMLEDDRARAFVARFFVPWLGLDRLGTSEPDKVNFPDFDVSLRDAMTEETERFLLSQLREDRDPIELWSANYTFLNEQLARHYGIAGVTGAQFRRVDLSAPERAGLLGQGSVHMVTSRHQPGPTGGYTSPAARSMWILQHFLGAPPPRPFPGAQPVKPELPITPQTRALPAQPCANCHRNFFPLGYALENFDPVGRWRTQDQIGPVDASGSFVDGTSMNGVVELRATLLQRPDAFRTTMTEKLLVFASGRSVTASRVMAETLVRTRQILRRAAPLRWSSIIAAIVRAQPLPAE